MKTHATGMNRSSLRDTRMNEEPRKLQTRQDHVDDTVRLLPSSSSSSAAAAAGTDADETGSGVGRGVGMALGTDVSSPRTCSAK